MEPSRNCSIMLLKGRFDKYWLKLVGFSVAQLLHFSYYLASVRLSCYIGKCSSLNHEIKNGSGLEFTDTPSVTCEQCSLGNVLLPTVLALSQSSFLSSVFIAWKETMGNFLRLFLPGF